MSFAVIRSNWVSNVNSSGSWNYSTRRFCFLLSLLVVLVVPEAAAQDVVDTFPAEDSVDFAGEAELMAWGNLEGIRLGGELFPFKSSIRVVTTHWDLMRESGMHRPDQAPVFARAGNARTVAATLAPIRFEQVVTSVGPGVANIDVTVTALSDTTLDGVYFHLQLLASDYADGSFGFIGTTREGDENISIEGDPADVGSDFVRASAEGLRFGSIDRKIDINFGTPTGVIVREDTTDTGQHVLNAYMTMMTGQLAEGESVSNRFTVSVSGVVDTETVTVSVRTSRPGRLFDGIGGNFKIENAQEDLIAATYNMEQLNPAWGRVEMPMRYWHSNEALDPGDVAEADGLHERVEQAMEMARDLARKRTSVIISIWDAPKWAYVARMTAIPSDSATVVDSLVVNSELQRQDGAQDSTEVSVDPSVTADLQDAVNNAPVPVVRSRRLDPEKIDKLVHSIADYLLHLKRYYGVEPAFVSLNEPDLGIGILQSADEHSKFIVALGKQLTRRGLATRLLLGDTSNAYAKDFVKEAMANPDARPYIGALSFHSWSGWEDGTLEFWREASYLLGVPLIVAAGATDPSARQYPQVFFEPSYAMNEIKQYAELLAIAQPQSILQWQLTADYPILRDTSSEDQSADSLMPTQRFWNLKQLSSTPRQSFWLPVSCNNASITCAAFGDIANGRYAVHIVNDGAARMMNLSGLPDGLQDVKVFVTDQHRAMQEIELTEAGSDHIVVELPPVSFTTVIVQ